MTFLAKLDKRIIKTHSALASAFFELLDESDIDDITVNTLCEKAGIRRATFYGHFKDKTDFLTFIIARVRDSFDEKCLDVQRSNYPTKSYYLEYASELINFFYIHEEAITKILSSNMRDTIIDIFIEKNYQDTKRRLTESVKGGMKLPASVETVTGMLIGGVAQILIRWFDSKDRIPLVDLVDEITAFIEYILKQE